MALCTPNALLKDLQDKGEFSKLMVVSEEVKMLPFGEIWEHYCETEGVVAGAEWFDEIVKYETEVLAKR